MKILIAEDNRVSQLLLKDTLQKLGHEVTATGNGAEAFQALLDSDLSLVVSDWMMPEMDGLELVRRIRARQWDRYVYVIMLTTLGETENVAEALDAGANDYLRKPFEAVELRARLAAGARVVELERRLADRVAELEEHIRTINQLKELLPICMYCKKIRDDGDYWNEVEVYLHRNAGTDFSHGICPDCYETVVKPDLAKTKNSKPAPG